MSVLSRLYCEGVDFTKCFVYFESDHQELGRTCNLNEPPRKLFMGARSERGLQGQVKQTPLRSLVTKKFVRSLTKVTHGSRLLVTPDLINGVTCSPL